MNTPDSTRNWVAAGVGFAVALVLIVAVQWFLLDRSRRVESEVRRLTYEAERTTYLIGDVGQLLAQLQADFAQPARADRSALASRPARLRSIDAELQAHSFELVKLLSPREREVWSGIEAQISTRRASLPLPPDVERSGTGAAVETSLAPLSDFSRLFDSLRSLLELNQVETKRQMNEANELLASNRIAQQVVAVLQLLGVAAIGFLAIRVIRGRDVATDSYLRCIERENNELVAFTGRVAHELPLYFATLQSAGHGRKGT